MSGSIRWFAMGLMLTGSVVATASAPPSPVDSPFILHVPKGLEDPPLPDDNPLTADKIELGRMLYFDKRLSSDGTVACATCHDAAKGWAENTPVSTGIKGQKGGRNAPTVVNSAYGYFQFWDGRAKTLEDQALGPVQNPIEMGEKIENVVAKLNAIPGYKSRFQKVFGTDVTSQGMAKAIAAFERTVLSGDSPFDRYEKGDKTAMSPAAVRGYEVFRGKGNCTSCHVGFNLSDSLFHNLGVGI